MRIDAITFKQLRALLAVVEHGSLTAAAKALHQTTPTIHSQIRNLEACVGQKLLNRAGDGGAFVATPAGEAFLHAARRIEVNLAQAKTQVTALTEGKTGHVTLGTVSTAKYFAPGLVRLLRDRAPDIEVSLKIANRSETIRAMERGEYDITIMGRPSRKTLGKAIPLGPHPHGIVVPADHPLANKDNYDPADLLEETFLCREEGSGTRALMERYVSNLSIGAVPPMVEMQSNETIKQAVLAGLGIGFLSLHTVHDEVTSGRLALVRGRDLPVMRHWYLIVPEDPANAPSEAALRIAKEIEALAGRYLPKFNV
ncbi:LysR family transcriptional regulator [Notoacmeibacter sp. MSK16QG-6]|uniref:LysR family transcriptional regulator n=1 Tax=Notoacmeibacter sp. MSK16QG-6 TaxID=2957982 RepID=UPI00209FA68D|nr:LysR family transcriptional regulator [Notoacmeibacter sp. MSK16QG-6]MCP1198384.1 LysR family transcriptional regulator [Notoacmeibacter sp. MSK16QG-6]